MKQFGSNEFMACLTGTTCDYDVVYPSVDAVIRPFVCRNAREHPELWDDLLQDIHLAVWQNFPVFLERAPHYAPQQRLSWLYTIAANKINDTFRTLARPAGQPTELTETLPDPCGNPETQLLLLAHSEELSSHVDNLLRKACSMRSRPENTLAFLYNRVVMPLETEHTKKGDNKTVQMRLNGQPLGEIRKQLEQDLTHALGREIPSTVLAPLDKAMQGHEDQLFQLSARQIATASYSVANALSTAHERSFSLDSNEAAYGLTKNRVSLIIHRLLRLYRKDIKEGHTMNDQITADEYIMQTQNTRNITGTPGILLEAGKTTSAEELADQLFPVPRWIYAACASWEDASALPQKLVRRFVLECGLRSRFEGGAIIDLRWCSGSPVVGQLCRLEQFLLDLRTDLCPMILTAPGASHEVWEHLSALQLQPVTIGQDARTPKPRKIGFEREY